MASIRFSRVVSVIGLCSALPSCSNEPGLCPGVERGAEYRIEILGLADAEQSPPFCHSDWGFIEGATFQGTVVDSRGGLACESGILDAPGIEDWRWELGENQSTPGGGLLFASYRVSRGDCSGIVVIETVEGDSGDCTLGVDEVCRLLVRVWVDAEFQDACPEDCNNILNVHVEKLE